MNQKSMRSIISIPSGKCPHLLGGTDKESVVDWIEKVRSSAPAGVIYRPSALRYWIRDTYDINGPEYRIAANILDSLLAD